MPQMLKCLYQIFKSRSFRAREAEDDDEERFILNERDTRGGLSSRPRGTGVEGVRRGNEQESVCECEREGGGRERDREKQRDLFTIWNHLGRRQFTCRSLAVY